MAWWNFSWIIKYNGLSYGSIFAGVRNDNSEGSRIVVFEPRINGPVLIPGPDPGSPGFCRVTLDVDVVKGDTVAQSCLYL